MIHVHMAVNNRYGNLSGFCDSIEIEAGDENLTLEPTIVDENLRGPGIWIEENKPGDGRFRFKDGEVWGNWFEFADTTPYVGNIIWNVYYMAGVDVVRLLKTLKRSGIWEPSEGTSTWWKWWDNLNDKTTRPPWESVIAKEIK